MCRRLKVQRSSYYKWLHRRETAAELEDRQLAQWIIEYDERFHHILGYRRMRMYVNAFNHKGYSRKRIQRIMGILQIHAVIRRPKYQYHYSRPEEMADNLLKRDFLAAAPNEKWATDVSELRIPHENRKLYLSAIIDLYDRSIVAHVVSVRNDNRLVFDTFQKAVDLNPTASPLFHSDRGFQYTSRIFMAKLRARGMTPSMSRTGHCIDNGPTEGLWGIIKTEMYQMYDIKDESSLRNAIECYIRFYNYERLQERFDSQTPIQVRTAALKTESPVVFPIAQDKRIIRYKEHLAALAARA